MGCFFCAQRAFRKIKGDAERQVEQDLQVRKKALPHLVSWQPATTKRIVFLKTGAPAKHNTN